MVVVDTTLNISEAQQKHHWTYSVSWWYVGAWMPESAYQTSFKGLQRVQFNALIVTHYSFLRCCDMPPRMPKRINKHVANKTPISLSPSNFQSGPSKNFVFLISRRVERAFCNCFDSIPPSTPQSPSWSCHHSSISLIYTNFRFQWYIYGSWNGATVPYRSIAHIFLGYRRATGGTVE